MDRFDRRSFVQLLGAGAAASLVYTFSEQRALGASRAPTALQADTRGLFDLSVASGDPSTSGIVLWTHLAPALYDPQLALWVQISTSESFSSLVAEAQLVGVGSGVSDNCVRAVIDGVLSAGKRYFYRFIYGNTVSRVGRCKTLPSGSPSAVKLALITCQDFTNGYYGAFRALAADDTVDYVVHLGDFIYESVGDPRFQDMNGIRRT